MNAGGRGGRQAAMPSSGWRPPERLLEASGGTAVRVIEESGARSRVFDFADIQDPKGRRVVVDEGLQRWFASAFAERTSPRSGVKICCCALARSSNARNHGACARCGRRETEGE